MLEEGQMSLKIYLNIIINIIGNDISSGTEHIYRGAMIICGAAKKKIFHKA